MGKLLHIEASPRKARSHSIAIANEFIEAYKTKYPDNSVETLDVWHMTLPAFDGDMLDAKYAVMGGQSPSPQQESAWASVRKLFDQFNSADKYVFSVPMWNFNVPYRLKHYIDLITQPGMAWSYSPEESYKGLLKSKSALVIYSSGDGYSEGTGFEAYDLQKPYINLWLNFIGVTDIKTITVEATLFPDRNTEAQAKLEALKIVDEL